MVLDWILKWANAFNMTPGIFVTLTVLFGSAFVGTVIVVAQTL
jgi:hypothetical protein